MFWGWVFFFCLFQFLLEENGVKPPISPQIFLSLFLGLHIFAPPPPPPGLLISVESLVALRGLSDMAAASV